MFVVGLCSVDLVILIFVAIFGDYKAVMAKDKERPMSRNVGYVVNLTQQC